MIPADLASRLRLVAQEIPAPAQPVIPARQLTDVLSDVSTGQRILAEIQAQMPNGAYRAIVGQREITLALPFLAKAGDTIELEVVETDGKKSLSFVSNRGSAESSVKGSESVPTTLSKTGNLIGNLLTEIEQQGGRAKPAALNANQPLITSFPDKASDLAPILKDSLIKSGMFYEAHQAKWVEGKISTANLLLEPQGKLSTLIPPGIGPRQQAMAESLLQTTELSANVHLSESSLQKTASEVDTAGTNNALIKDSGQGIGKESSALSGQNMNQAGRSETTLRESNPLAQQQFNNSSTESPLRSNAVHPELTPIVQQQLNGLASQNYVWQGQVWPGQNMQWEIAENDGRPRTGPDEISEHWQTRLKLELPNLGGIEAKIGLGLSGKLTISLKTDQEITQNMLQSAGSMLEKSLQSSGLQLNNFLVSHGEISS